MCTECKPLPLLLPLRDQVFVVDSVAVFVFTSLSMTVLCADSRLLHLQFGSGWIRLHFFFKPPPPPLQWALQQLRSPLLSNENPWVPGVGQNI